MPPLLDLALQAHGGLDRWRSLAALRLHLRVRGNLLASRFKSPFTRLLDVDIDTHSIHAVLSPFPSLGHRGLFEGDTVRIETDDGQPISARSDARAHAIAHTFWDDLDLLYFFGYAFWNYAMTPFLFCWPGFTMEELEPWHDGNRLLRRLAVRYPAGFPTHSRDQVFYFDESGLLRRLDYVAEVFSPTVRGAHLLEAHRPFSGLVFPTHRVVYPAGKDLRPRRLLAAMEGWIDGVEVVEAQP